jgi:hypothetical protein
MMKKFMFLMLLFLSVALVFSPGCKTSDEADTIDITGTWTLTTNYGGLLPFTFTGTTAAGNTAAVFMFGNGNGTYSVSGSNITFSIFWPENGNTTNCTGTVNNSNSMSGSFTETSGGLGNWTATR